LLSFFKKPLNLSQQTNRIGKLSLISASLANVGVAMSSSSNAGRVGPGPGQRRLEARASQMNAQQEMIAKRKAELEAKKDKEDPNKAEEATKRTAATVATPRAPPKKVMNLKNRW